MAFPTSGCVAYYRLDDASGTSAADATGLGNTGTLTNTPTWTTGKINGALSFAAASNQYVDCGTALNPAAISYSAWINATSFPNSYNAIVARQGSANHFSLLLVKSTGKLAIYMGNGAALLDYDGTGTNTLSTSTWYHIVCTYDSTAGLVGYVNGSSDGTAAANGTLTTDAVSTYIGENPTFSTRGFNGIIDEVGIWNRALTSTEVTTLYNGGTGLSFPGGGGSTQSLFRPSLLNGIGSGGPFFNNPIGRSMLGWVPTLKGLLIPKLVTA